MPVLALRARRQFGEQGSKVQVAENATRCHTLSEEDQFGEGDVPTCRGTLTTKNWRSLGIDISQAEEPPGQHTHTRTLCPTQLSL